jgi:hypothetical protein
MKGAVMSIFMERHETERSFYSLDKNIEEFIKFTTRKVSHLSFRAKSDFVTIS